MQVLVTGGTGFVGRAIVNELLRNGHAVHLLIRSQRQPPSSNVQLHPGNILDANSLRLPPGLDAIIHLVGIISEVGEQTFENVHTRGTENMIAAAKRADVKRFIQMSALGTKPNAVARYHRSKWSAEELVRQSGLDWTIFRPSIIYGPGDGFVNLFANIIRRSPFVPIIGNGRTRFQPIPVECVASAFVQSLTEPRSIGQTFDLAGPEVFTLNEIVDLILAAMNRKRIKLHLPLSIARIQAALMEFVFAGLLRKAPPLNRDQVTMLQEDNVGDGRAARELFNLQPGRFGDGIARYLGD
jgi:NADH dehydrogenase